jgi:invasion protein IalB
MYNIDLFAHAIINLSGRRSTRLALVCLALLAPVAAEAQNKPPAAAPAPAAQQPAAARVLKTETANFDSWTVTCNTMSQPANARRCFAHQAVVNDKSRQVMVTLTVGPNARGEQHLDVQTPTATSIPEGVTLKFEPGGAPIRLPFMFCDPNSCVASVALDPTLSAALQGATQASVVWASLRAGPIKIDFPLKGAREAVAALAK